MEAHSHSKPIAGKAMGSPWLWCETYGFVEKGIIPDPQQGSIRKEESGDMVETQPTESIVTKAS